MPGYIECQPLSFRDFSGGLTDNFLQGDTTRYARADNFLITVDRKLEERSGTKLYDPVNYSMGPATRVTGLFTGINETVLFAHSGRNIYTQLPDSSYGGSWNNIRGPTNNEPISGGSIYNLLTSGEFQRQTYFATDYGTQPTKIFRDQNNVWKAVTAGLPKMAFAPNYPNDASLVLACITLANALRASMVSHFADQANMGSGVSAIYQHKNFDKWSASYFATQTWNSLADTEYPGPIPAPTPAPAATDAASLYALCQALSLSFEHHRNDLAGASPTLSTTSGNKYYHQDIHYDPTGTSNPYGSASGSSPTGLGINVKLGLSGVVSNPTKAAAFLDELTQKWNWHMLSPFSHSMDNTYSVMSRYLVTTPKVGTIYSSTQTVQATPNYNDFIALAYWMKKAWNNHQSGVDSTSGNMHSQVDPYGPITLPDPIDFDSAALVMFWCRWLYGQIHLADASFGAHTRITFSSTTGSANITAVTSTSLGTTIALPVDSWVLVTASYFNDTVTQNRKAARVMASATGTATLSRTVILGDSAHAGQYSNSWLHGAYVNGTITAAGSDTTAQFPGVAEFLALPGNVGTDISSWIQLSTEFLTCFGAHEANGVSHKTQNFLGNELGGTAPINGNPFFVPSVATYAYALFYRYQYTVEQNGLLYLNQGSPVFTNSIQTTFSYPVGTILPSYNTAYFNTSTILVENKSVTLSGIPSLVNTSLTNYDTNYSVAPQPTDSSVIGYYENLTLEIYRTTSGGTTFYYLDQVTNSVPALSQSYTDAVNENLPRAGASLLNLGKVLYTSGGVVANDQPPISKYVLALSGFMYYGGITDTGQFFPQRIRQSIQGSPDSAPATFFDDLEDELTGLSSARSNLIGLCKNSVYRVSGSFTSTGQGSMSHEKISDSIGCLNAKSVVRTEIGVFFAGSDGFYYTDGYQVIKISIDLDATYRKATTSDNQKARIYGSYDKLTRRIWWAMSSQATSQDNDMFFIFYLDYGVKPSGVFTRALTTASWQPSSAVFYKGELTIGDSRGYLFKTDTTCKTDPKIDLLNDPGSWNTSYVPYDFRTCALDFGTTFMRKWVTRIHSVGKNIGNGAIQIVSVNDNNDTTQGPGILNLPPIQYVGNPTWGDANVVWGTSSYNWKFDGKMDLWRRFPARSMRQDFKQIRYTPGNFVVYASDSYPAFCFSNTNSTTKTATIVTPSGFTAIVWPNDVVDMYISFDTDNYVNQFLVTAVSGAVITYSDATNLSVTKTGKWQIKGIKKEQRIAITSFDVHFATLGDENQDYPGDTLSQGPGGLGGNS